jgi:hypothetical protein
MSGLFAMRKVKTTGFKPVNFQPRSFNGLSVYAEVEFF